MNDEQVNQKIINTLMLYEPLNALILGLYNDYRKGADKHALQRMNGFIEQNKAKSNHVSEVKHGKWIYDISDVGWTDYYGCSVCRNLITVEGQDEDLYPYCPYCGARMDGKE